VILCIFEPEENEHSNTEHGASMVEEDPAMQHLQKLQM